MRRNNQPVFGIILILLGILLFFYGGKVNISVWNQVMWIIPITFLGGGVIFHIVYFSSPHRNRGMLIPGGILLTYSILTFICISNNDWGLAAAFWPLFPLGVAIGFIEYILACKHRNNVFMPLLVIGGIGIGFLCINLEIFKKGRIISLLFLIIGFILIIRSNRKKIF